MRITYRLSRILTKIFFSAVIFQMLFIVLGAESGEFSPYTVLLMLEHSAASGAVALGSGVLLEYIAKNSE